MLSFTKAPQIRILYVDDSHLDRELVRAALADSDEFQITEVKTGAEFEEHLRHGEFDLVLSDFNILGYDGLQVINAVQQIRAELPVVIVTGTGSEEIAVEAMKLGACEYVIKSPQHIRRLPLTIRSVLEQAKLEEERERAIAELDRFFELSRDLLCVLDETGRFHRTNPAAEDILGYPPEELKEQTLHDLVHPDDRALLQLQFRQSARRSQCFRFTVRCLTKRGRERWLEWNVSQSGKPRWIYAVGRDISERKADEEAQRERAVAQAKFSTLSPREQDVLKLVIHGDANKVIARKLGVSEKTVERHRSHGMKKLKLTTVPDLVRLSLLAEL